MTLWPLHEFPGFADVSAHFSENWSYIYLSPHWQAIGAGNLFSLIFGREP